VAQKYAGYLYKSGQVDEGHYAKVNEMINELKVTLPEAERGGIVQSNVNIQWPNDPNMEVISVAASTLDDVFGYELANLSTVRSTTNVVTGTKVQGRKCEKIFSCYKVDKEDFWRYANTQSAGVSQ